MLFRFLGVYDLFDCYGHEHQINAIKDQRILKDMVHTCLYINFRNHTLYLKTNHHAINTAILTDCCHNNATDLNKNDIM